MMNKKQTIKIVALAVLCTVALPVQAFNLRELWNSFKQSPQAHIVAGFSAAAATVASLGYFVYKYRFQKPAAPIVSTPALSNKSEGSAAFNSLINPHMDLKHTQERLDAERDTLGNIVAGNAMVHPFPEFPSYARDKRSQAYLSAIAQKPQPFAQLTTITDTSRNSISCGVSTASGAQTPVALRSEDLGGNVSKPSALVDNARASGKKSIPEEKGAASALAALIKAEKTRKKERDEETQKVTPIINHMHSQLESATRALLREDITIGGVAKQIAILDQIRTDLFSFNVCGDDYAQRFIDNFKSTSIKPKEAYSALRRYGLAPSSTAEIAIKASDIRERIDRLIETEKIKTPQDVQTLKDLRQLRYVFSNDIIAAQYDAYSNDRPVVSITSEVRNHIANTIEAAKSDAFRIQDDLRKKQANKNWNEEYEMVEVLGRKNPTASASTTVVDLGEKPLSINAISLVHPETSTQPSMAAQILMSGISTATFGANAVWNRISPKRTSATTKTTDDKS